MTYSMKIIDVRSRYKLLQLCSCWEHGFFIILANDFHSSKLQSPLIQRSLPIVRIKFWWTSGPFCSYWCFLNKTFGYVIKYYLEYFIHWTSQKCIEIWTCLRMFHFEFLLNPFHPSVAFHIETSYFFLFCKTNYWFLYKTQHWDEMGWFHPCNLAGFSESNLADYLFSIYAKFSKKPTFITSLIRTRSFAYHWGGMLVFRKIVRTY